MNETERHAAWLRIDALQTGPVETVTGKLFDVRLVNPERGIQIHLQSSAEDRWIPALARRPRGQSLTPLAAPQPRDARARARRADPPGAGDAGPRLSGHNRAVSARAAD